MTGLVLVLGAVAPASAHAAPLVWSSPFSIGSAGTRDVSCPLASLCVATNSSGNVITSTSPAGGASAWSSASLPLGSGVGLDAVSCVPGTTFCVTMSTDSASGNNDVWTSSNPAGGASTWTDQGTITATGFSGAAELSCPSTSFCVAQDGDGVGARGNPGDASTWHSNAISNNSAGELSCPTTSFCLSEDTNGFVHYTTAPATAGFWNGTDLNSVAGGSLYSSSCPTTNACLVGGAGDTDNLVTSTHPTASNASAWTATSIAGLTTIEAISCPDVSFCVAGDAFGHLGQSRDPLGGASTWTSTDADGSQLIPSVACADDTLCVAVDASGNAIVGTLPSYTLTVTKAGTGGGTVSDDSGRISCGTTCSASFFSGTPVTLIAHPANGSTFTGWSGGGCSGTSTCTVTINSPTSVAATFTLTPRGQQALTVTKTGSGSGTVRDGSGKINCGSACSADFNHGQPVSLSALPAAGSRFAGWSGACHGTGGCNLVMNADAGVTATFVKVQHTLTLTVLGFGDITLTASRSSQQCPSRHICSINFDDGTVVTAVPNPFHCCGFAGWSGAGCQGLGTCRITMDADKTLVAPFSASLLSFPSPSYCLSTCITDDGSYATQTVYCSSSEPCEVLGNTTCNWDGSNCVSASLTGLAGDVARAAADAAAARRAPRRIVLMRGSFTIPAHHKRTLRFRLTPAGKRFLRTHKRLKAVEFVIVKTHGHRILVKRTVTLIYRPAQRHSHH